jgi:hypothetical protein
MCCIQWQWKRERSVRYLTGHTLLIDVRRKAEDVGKEPQQNLWGWRTGWIETSVGCKGKQHVNRQKRFKDTGEENRCGHTYCVCVCVFYVCMWEDRTELPLAEGVNKTWQVLAYRETLADIQTGNITTIRRVNSVKIYLKIERASRRKIIWTQTNEWVKQYWQIIKKMKKDINNNGNCASAYVNRQAIETVLRRINSFYRIPVTWELWRNCGNVSVRKEQQIQRNGTENNF